MHGNVFRSATRKPTLGRRRTVLPLQRETAPTASSQVGLGSSARELVRSDGSRQSTFGANPKGIAFFDEGGHYIITVMRSDRAKYAINSFTEGTAEENKATAQGTITYFGTYAVSEADSAIAIRIDGSSFPNWNGADQKRIVAITGDQLKLTAPIAIGTAEVFWKRAQ